jgi:hypothetical protein
LPGHVTRMGKKKNAYKFWWEDLDIDGSVTQQDRQYTYDVTLRHVRVTIVAVEEQ